MIFQSYNKVNNWGTKFQPNDPSSLLLSTSSSALFRCSALCNTNRQCRTFDYDSSTHICRLFDTTLDEGNITSSVQTQCVGSLKISSNLFANYGAPCSQCVLDRYLACSSSGTCECPIGSCWNGTQCGKRQNFNASNSQSTSNWCIQPVFNILWPFDGNTYDSKYNYTSISSDNISYTLGYSGNGLALMLVRSSSQFIKIPSRQILFYSTSFTLQTWIYPVGFTSSNYGIFGQCETNVTTANKCMFFVVRNYTLTCSLGNNSISGNTSLTMNQWSYVACVYNITAKTLQVYLNGKLDGSCSSPGYQGSSGDTTIGVTYLTSSGSNYFNGYLDQMQFISTAQSSVVILRAATLVAYYSFDTTTITDSGPYGVNATALGSLTLVPGKVNQAILFNSTGYIRTNSTSFLAIGTSNQSHSYTVWIKPTPSNASSTILFVYGPTGWCVGIITMTVTGNISMNSYSGQTITVTGPILPLNSWTHFGSTYSRSNGMKIYINGILYASSGVFNYVAAGSPVYIVIGYHLGADGCVPQYGGRFLGALDEFCIYNRELTTSEMFAIANS